MAAGSSIIVEVDELDIAKSYLKSSSMSYNPRSSEGSNVSWGVGGAWQDVDGVADPVGGRFVAWSLDSFRGLTCLEIILKFGISYVAPALFVELYTWAALSLFLFFSSTFWVLA